ncbi:MAG: LuxR C-terminal-related transcriptional regulator [Acidobacteriota bacterium]
MDLRRVRAIVSTTGDPAFATDERGLIVGWNRASEELMGIPAEKSIGKPCGEVLDAADECGPVCSRDCVVQRAVHRKTPLRNFDFLIPTKAGRQWCNVSVFWVDGEATGSWYAVHILRMIDIRKRMELLLADFIRGCTDLPTEQVKALISKSRTPARDSRLTARELETLQLVSRGMTTHQMAKKMGISRTTVNNHIQHLMKKLGARTRLEALRRAERAGLLPWAHDQGQ